MHKSHSSRQNNFIMRFLCALSGAGMTCAFFHGLISIYQVNFKAISTHNNNGAAIKFYETRKTSSI